MRPSMVAIPCGFIFLVMRLLACEKVRRTKGNEKREEARAVTSEAPNVGQRNAG
jgi:hypothetical protein